MSDEVRFVPLARFATAAEAEMVKELLVREGIAAMLSGTSDPLGIVSGAQPILLLVAESDRGRARQLYRAFFHDLSEEDQPG